MSTRDTKKAAKWMAAQYARLGDPETTVADCQFMFEEDLDLMHREGEKSSARRVAVEHINQTRIPMRAIE